MQPKYVDTPLAAARAAREFALVPWFLWAAVLAGTLRIEHLPESIPLDENNTALMPTRTQDYLKTSVWNIILSTLAISSQAMDRALDDVFGVKPTWSPSLSDLEATRIIMYMVRCACAHDPMNPRWEVRSDGYRGVLCVKEIGLELDTTHLHGKELKIDQLGGQMGYVKLLNLCVKFLKIEAGEPLSTPA